MQPEFYAEGPVVLIERQERSLIIADPHFGVETDLHRHGLHFQSSTDSRLARLLSVIEQANPDYLIVLGDLKHMIPYVTYQERTEMPEVLRMIRKETAFRLAPGNHDAGRLRPARNARVSACRDRPLYLGTGAGRSDPGSSGTGIL